MKKWLLIFSLLLLFIESQSQQEINLCFNRDYTYSVVSSEPDVTFYWFIDGIFQFGQTVTIDWSELGEGDHTITVYGVKDGCTSNTLTYEITVLDCSTIYIPNSFTPDNDGINDLWYPVGVGWEWIDVTIFDRWGMQVWWSTDLDGAWDGSFRKGKYYVQNDVYAYKVIWKGYNNNPEIIYGHVVVIR